MKCRLCDDPNGLSIRMLDGSVIHECEGDLEQTTGLATLIADRAERLIQGGESIHYSIETVALDAIRKANR